MLLADTCASPRRSPRQPASSTSAQALCAGRVLEGRAAGLRAQRLRRLARGGDAVHLGLDRGGFARVPAEGGGDHHRPVGQRASGDRCSRGRRRASVRRSPERSTTSHSTSTSRDLAAVGAAVHPHEAADRAGDRAQELDPRDPRVARGRGDEDAARAAAAAQRRRVDRLDLARTACRAGPRRPARRRRGRSGSIPSPSAITGTAGSSSARKAARSSASAGSNSHSRRAARLEPDQRRERRVGVSRPRTAGMAHHGTGAPQSHPRLPRRRRSLPPPSPTLPAPRR